MNRSWSVVPFIVALVVVVVAADLLFFRDHPWLRLMANVGLVLVFGAVYLRYHPVGT